jgi:putative glutamine amidotransferase
MSRIRLGVSSCFFHAEPQRPTFNGRPLLFAEESMLRWLMTQNALPILLPRASGPISVDDLVGEIDGLVLQAGSDMSPTNYGERPARPEWEGDGVRDLYEMELIRACMQRDKPVLGVCRGLQVINVCLGGSLMQDIPTMHATSTVHRDAKVYERLFHDVNIKPNTWLSGVYGGAITSRINTVHHQCIKQLGRGLVVEAVSTSDDIIEAVRYMGQAPVSSAERVPFVLGVQWHPEFQDPSDTSLLSPGLLLSRYLDEVRSRRA